MSSTKSLFLTERWKEALNSPLKRSILIAGLSLIFTILYVLPIFFNKIEKIKGVVLHDRVLAAIPSHNVSAIIFSIIWGMSVLLIYRAIYKPAIVSIFIWTLIFICLARIISITLVPLDPPAGLIKLTDPVTGVFYGETTLQRTCFSRGNSHAYLNVFMPSEKDRQNSGFYCHNNSGYFIIDTAYSLYH